MAGPRKADCCCSSAHTLVFGGLARQGLGLFGEQAEGAWRGVCCTQGMRTWPACSRAALGEAPAQCNAKPGLPQALAIPVTLIGLGQQFIVNLLPSSDPARQRDRHTVPNWVCTGQLPCGCAGLLTGQQSRGCVEWRPEAAQAQHRAGRHLDPAGACEALRCSRAVPGPEVGAVTVDCHAHWAVHGRAAIGLERGEQHVSGRSQRGEVAVAGVLLRIASCWQLG